MLDLFRKYIDDRRYVFCINTGRSGSEYLAKLLATSRQVTALHEPQPEMTRAILQLVTHNTYAATFKQRRFKAAAVRKLAIEGGRPVYFESNHMFIKTYFDVVISKLRNVQVIYLRRNLIDTLSSFYELGYFSDWEPSWKHWMISPYAKTAAIKCPFPEGSQDQVGMIISYLLDIRARAKRFKEQYPHVPLFEVELRELNEENKVREMFDWMGARPGETTKELMGKRQNDRSELKKKIGGPVPDKELLRDRYYKHIEKLKEAGIALPEDVLAEL